MNEIGDDNINPNIILKKYIQNIEESNGNKLASNSIMMWHLRTIKGRNKIQTMFRYDLNHKYVHCFKDAINCLPFESNETQLNTRTEPPENFENTTISNRNELFDNSTPLTKQIDNSKLPPIKHNLEFQSMSSDDDDDDTMNEEMSSNMIIDNVTPEKYTNDHQNGSQCINSYHLIDDTDITPSSTSTMKRTYNCFENDNSYDKDSNEMPPNKRSKLEMEVSTITTTRTDTKQMPKSNYSKLYYLESIGKLSMKRRLKHRSITNPEHNCNHIDNHQIISSNQSIPSYLYDVDDDDGFSDETSSSSPFQSNTLVDNYCDRNIKLKISYRIRPIDRDIQFVLIIYEQLHKNSQNVCRNLLAQFIHADDDVVDGQTPKDSYTKKSSKKTSLSFRRLKFE